jgi:hypothetical protein
MAGLAGRLGPRPWGAQNHRYFFTNMVYIGSKKKRFSTERLKANDIDHGRTLRLAYLGTYAYRFESSTPRHIVFRAQTGDGPPVLHRPAVLLLHRSDRQPELAAVASVDLSSQSPECFCFNAATHA